MDYFMETMPEMDSFEIDGYVCGDKTHAGCCILMVQYTRDKEGAA